MQPSRKIRLQVVRHFTQGRGANSGERQDLMDESEIARPQKIETHLRIGVNVGRVVKRFAVADQVSAIKHRGSRAEYVQSFEKMPAANLSPRNKPTAMGQPVPRDFVSFQSIGADQTDGRILLRNCYHLFQAFGKDPVVTKHYLTVFTCWRDLPQCVVVIRDCG